MSKKRLEPSDDFSPELNAAIKKINVLLDERSELRQRELAIFKEAKIPFTKRPEDPKLLKELDKINARQKIVREQIAELEEKITEMKPARNTTRYDYPADMTEKEKKKLRSKLRKEAKKAAEGDEKPKKVKKVKKEESANVEVKSEEAPAIASAPAAKGKKLLAKKPRPVDED